MIPTFPSPGVRISHFPMCRLTQLAGCNQRAIGLTYATKVADGWPVGMQVKAGLADPALSDKLQAVRHGVC